MKPSVVYRLVQRHRWRKVAPDTRHPKTDTPGQETWKNAAKTWRPC
ncbi:MAG: winged helix-turn-helix domain-containing protein [Verrucomicrobiales bacterium]|nr:winged helix-turn-helix domain-containing protein [Verrucomicrobiales bacterium]